MRLLRRYAFLITVGVVTLAIGLLIYFAPTRLAPDPGASPPTDDEPTSTLSVDSQPPSAVVIVGADTAGATPVNNHSLSPGTYLVTIDRTNYGSRDTVITLSAGQSAALSPRFSRDESSAAAQDPAADSSQESRPSAPPIGSGDEASGSNPDRPATDRRPGSATSPTDRDIAPVTGTLVLRATPTTLTEVTTGTYDVAFSRPGHETVTQRVDVSAADTATVTATLKRRTGHLRVLVRPWGSIYIDDQRRAENSDV